MPSNSLRNSVMAAATLAAAAAAGDTVVDNVRGYTFGDAGLTEFSYLLFDDAGRVLRTGSGAAPAARTAIDGGGAVLLPGLIDAHGHVLGLGRAMASVDLAGTESLDEALRRIREFAAANGDADWITGRGWNQESWSPPRFPDAAALDRAVGGRPAFLTRVDGHAAWVNTRALELAGIDGETPPPEDGSILLGADGEPTGILVDAAMALVANRLPQPDAATDLETLATALNRLAAFGLTAVHDAGVDLPGLAAYRRLHRMEALPIRVYAMLAGMDTLRAVGEPTATADERLLVRSVKLYSDGALGSRGAALLEPYADDPGNSGLLFADREELAGYIAEARAAGFQVNVHAIGDRANRVLLDAFEAAGVDPGERHRDEHAQIVAPADIPRFARLGIVPSMQPTHATSDKGMAPKRLGRGRLAGAYAWRDFLDEGSRIAAGSDFPVESANPFLGWYAAVSRRDLAGEPPGGWLAEQKMTRAEAFRAFTLDAAWAAHMEGSTGSLEAGKWADFILVDADPFEVPERQIADIGVLETWVAGRRVWRRPAEPGRAEGP